MGIAQLTAIARDLLQFDQDLIKRQAISDDSAFVTYYVTDVPAGETMNLAISNPTSDTSADILGISYLAVFDGDFTIYDSFSSAPSGGDPRSPDSLLLDEAGGVTSSVIDVESDATFTSDGDPHFSRPTIASGVGDDPTGSGGSFADPLIEPGRSMVVELANTNADAGRAAIGIEYAELDRVPSRLL